MKRLLILALAAASPAASQEAPLQERVAAVLAEAGPGTRFGLVVATADGRELIAIAPDRRFIPASNTKMFTTAAAFAILADLDQPDSAGGAAVRLEDDDVILTGYGDARLSSAADCVSDCLAALADVVAAETRTVGDIVGDDSLFPDQRWAPGWSWEDLATRYGTATSALTLDDNELLLTVTPSAPGKPPTLEGLGYFEIENRAVTVAAGEADLDFARLPGSRVLRLTGTIAAGGDPALIHLGIDDPAHYAAWRFKAMLEERGVQVSGDVVAHHRALGPADDPEVRGATPPARPPRPEALARLVPPPLVEDLVTTNKVSQNLHAELTLRRVGLADGTGSIADGLAAVDAMLQAAGVPETGYAFSDGSGMSIYNRLAPRSVVAFLGWVADQPWGDAWRATLPVACIDGTLARRFCDTPLEGRLFAKTGTLNGTSALSGYMTGRSGRTLIFSIFANDAPEGVARTAIMDAALALIAAEN